MGISPELKARLDNIDKKLTEQDGVLSEILGFGSAMEEDMKLDIVEAYLRAYKTFTDRELAKKLLSIIQVIIFY
jgi:hypothetical protein